MPTKSTTPDAPITPGTTNAPLSLADWRKKRVQTYTTVDGLELSLRQANVLDLAEQGAIPQAILATLMELQGKDEAQAQQMMLSQMDELARTVNAVVCAMVRRPAVISQDTAQAIIQRITETYGDTVTPETVAAWLDDAAAGDDVPELAGVERALLVQRYIGSILVTELGWDDRMAIFTTATAGVGPVAAFPAQAS